MSRRAAPREDPELAAAVRAADALLSDEDALRQGWDVLKLLSKLRPGDEASLGCGVFGRGADGRVGDYYEFLRPREPWQRRKRARWLPVVAVVRLVLLARLRAAWSAEAPKAGAGGRDGDQDRDQ